ncbi:hypothetical protein H7H37_24475 [Mycolicibacterium insubricum]|nr:hypothetical protein [Mycolicibacterium insubricum]
MRQSRDRPDAVSAAPGQYVDDVAGADHGRHRGVATGLGTIRAPGPAPAAQRVAVTSLTDAADVTLH